MLLNTIRFIANHPFNKGNKLKAVWRFISWQLSIRLTPFPILYQFTERSRLVISQGQSGATGNLYCGLLEYYDMSFVLHFLREEDLFLDIGANVGVYSVLASAEIGARTICVEPIPSTYEVLQDNININAITDKVQSHLLGLGSEEGELKFTRNADTTNRVALSENEITNSIDVKVTTLDNLITEKCPSLIKIDVEGFETEVLKGGRKTLQNQELKALIIELNGAGKDYGYDDNEIHESLINQAFKPYTYDPLQRRLFELDHYGEHNTIYIRDIEFVNKRILSARRVKVRDREL